MSDDSDPEETVRFGIVASRRLRDELDETKRRRERQRYESVSRSAVAREALWIGLAVIDELDSEPALRSLHTQESRALARQAVQSELSDSD